MSYKITGRANTVVNNRLSVYDLQNNQKQFSLFVLAYLVVQDRVGEVQKLLSNFTYASPLPATFQEIAGIHGLPYSQYSGDPNNKDPSHYDGNDKKDTLPAPSRFGGNLRLSSNMAHVTRTYSCRLLQVCWRIDPQPAAAFLTMPL